MSWCWTGRLQYTELAIYFVIFRFFPGIADAGEASIGYVISCMTICQLLGVWHCGTLVCVFFSCS